MRPDDPPHPAPISVALDRPPAVSGGPAARERAPVRPFGLVASLVLHLLPLLLLLHWTSAPAEMPAAIPVQLVIEPPPLPPPPATPEQQARPPRGRLASEEMGDAKAEKGDAAAPPAAAQPEKFAAAVPPPPRLVAPPPEMPPPPPPQLDADAPAPLPLPKPAAPKQQVVTVLHRMELPLPLRPPHPARAPGPAATRDEYLAYLVTLMRRHLDLMPPSFVAGRRGLTVLSIVVRGDGTIARIGVAEGSGYDDIDARIAQMVAAVGRFPPLPQWFQGPPVELYLRLRFPEALEH